MIIFSPTKTMNLPQKVEKNQHFIFELKVQQLVEQLQAVAKHELGTYLKIKGQILDNTYHYYQTFNQHFTPTIHAYNGVSFRQIKTFDQQYLASNVFVLSALYGINNALQPISQYRLDFSHSKVFSFSLYNFWAAEVTNFINHQQTNVLNLASHEYSKMVNKAQLSVPFFDTAFVRSQKLTSVDLKKLRGHILDYCILNQIYDYQKLQDMQTKWVSKVTLDAQTLIFHINPKLD